MLRIKLIKSTVAHNPRNRRTVEALGLKRVHHVVEHEDTPVIRGMIHNVKELLHVEVVEGTPKARNHVKKGKKVAAEAVEAAPVVEAVAEAKPKKSKKAAAEESN